VWSDSMFQSLIGRLKTHKDRGVPPLCRSFNPS